MPPIPNRLDADTVRKLRVEFEHAKQRVDASARWASGDPSMPAGVCRLCGRQRQWFSTTDAHVACMVDDEFKAIVGEVLRPAHVTYGHVAEVLGVTMGAIRSWAFAAGIVGPVKKPGSPDEGAGH